ncbi:hypothetical protein RB200_01195 [Streptomyces sp. PmtG]
MQLPPGLPDFTGRAAELDRLLPDVAAHDGREQARQWRLTVVTGPPCVGKSSLAVAAGHAAADAYPGGLFHVDLRDVSGRPKSPTAALTELLRELGDPTLPLPNDAQALLHSYRARMPAGAPSLLLLDNAVSEAQVRPLLPNSPLATTVVTSCSRLAGLDGSEALELRPLDEGASLDLLRRICGPACLDAEPQSALRLVRLCRGLPLALRIAGARLALGRACRLAKIVDRLESGGALDWFTVGDIDLRQRLGRGFGPLTDTDWAQLRLLDREGDFTFMDAWHRLGGDPVDTDRALARLWETHALTSAREPGPDGTSLFRFTAFVRELARERPALGAQPCAAAGGRGGAGPGGIPGLPALWGLPGLAELVGLSDADGTRDLSDGPGLVYLVDADRRDRARSVARPQEVR